MRMLGPRIVGAKAVALDRSVTQCDSQVSGAAAGQGCRLFAYTAHCHGQRFLLCHAMGRHLMTETLCRTITVLFVLVLLVSV
jgi:hypothetical protein